MVTSSVFVSGATGYIAQHIVKQLIDKGYNVVGSVRSEEKGENLKRLLNSDRFTYEIIEAVEKEGAFDEALKKHPEVTVFIHTASPLYFDVKDIEKELLIPAVNGTKNALSSIKKYAPQVKRLVFTSSFAAIFPENGHDPKVTITEESWNNITWEQALSNPLFGYLGSKALAEKAVWEFVKNEKPNFVVSTINPVYVFGPQAFDENAKGTLNVSAEVINSIINLKEGDEVPLTTGGFADVRDVAKGHILAFEKEETKNQRLVLLSSKFTSQGILDILHEKFPEFAAKLPRGEPGVDNSKKIATIDHLKSKEILGINYYSYEDTIVDSIKQILNNK